MTTEQQLIEALQTAVKTQSQLIECLKIEIDRLKSQQLADKLTSPTPILPGSPYPPSQPWPIGPGVIPCPQYPPQPWNPLPPPYIVTYTGDNLFQQVKSAHDLGARGMGELPVYPVTSGALCVTTTPLPPINLED